MISKALSLNRLPREIRDQCRQDPSVPRNILVEIARKKQERSMLTRFRKYQEQQARIAAKEAGTPAPAERKRTKAEASPTASAAWQAKWATWNFPTSPRRSGP